MAMLRAVVLALVVLDVMAYSGLVQGDGPLPPVRSLNGSAVDSAPRIDELALALAASDPLVARMQLGSHLDDPLARSDATILLNAFLVYTEPSFDVDTSRLLNPFADADESADYFPALARLAYYRGTADSKTVVTKGNDLFQPLRPVLRQEFVAMLLQGADIALTPGVDAIGGFQDVDDVLGRWTEPYFNTAVKLGIVVGNAGYLYPENSLSIREALYLLYRAMDFARQSGDPSSFETSAELNLDALLLRRIGSRFEAEHRLSGEVSIHLADIAWDAGDDAEMDCGLSGIVLQAVIDQISVRPEVTPFFWWHSDYGYFRRHPDGRHFDRVCFYPNDFEPPSGYHVSVGGGDNIGSVDSIERTIPGDSFEYPNDSTSGFAQSTGIRISSKTSVMRAGKVFEIDLSDTVTSKASADLGIERVNVAMVLPDGSEREVYSGQPDTKIVRFLAPDIPGIYGRKVRLKLLVNTQDVRDVATTEELLYSPRFLIRGQVYKSSSDAPQSRFVEIGGQKAYIDDAGVFSYELLVPEEPAPLLIAPEGFYYTNVFDPSEVTLTYEQPQAFVVFFGKDLSRVDDNYNGISDLIDEQWGLSETDALTEVYLDGIPQGYTYEQAFADGLPFDGPDDDNDGVPDVDDPFPSDAALGTGAARTVARSTRIRCFVGERMMMVSWMFPIC